MFSKFYSKLRYSYRFYFSKNKCFVEKNFEGISVKIKSSVKHGRNATVSCTLGFICSLTYYLNDSREILKIENLINYVHDKNTRLKINKVWHFLLLYTNTSAHKHSLVKLIGENWSQHAAVTLYIPVISSPDFLELLAEYPDTTVTYTDAPSVPGFTASPIVAQLEILSFNRYIFFPPFQQLFDTIELALTTNCAWSLLPLYYLQIASLWALLEGPNRW